MATRAIKITGSGNSSNLFFVNWSTNTYHYSPETLAIDDGTSVSVYANNPITLNGSQVASSGYYDFTISKDLTINLTNSGISITDGVSKVSLPSGYTRLEYIESTGTQWINTGVIGNSNIKVVAKFIWNAGRVFIGSTTANDDTRCFPTFKYGNGNYFGYGYVTTYQASKAVVYGTNYTIETDFKVGTQSMKVNGEVIKTTANTTNFNNGFPLYMFAANFGGTVNDKGSFQCYYCKIYEKDILVRDFIPCKNASGAVGLWDTVNGKFYGNSGTGTFISKELPKSHKTLVGGTEYEPISGRCFIDGTGYKIKKGRTLVAGTGYDIPFTNHVVTVKIPETWTYDETKSKVWIDGVQLYDGDVVEVADGDILTCFVKPGSSYPGYVKVNNKSVMACGTETSAGKYYEYTITGDIEVNIFTSSQYNSTGSGMITIIEEGYTFEEA